MLAEALLLAPAISRIREEYPSSGRRSSGDRGGRHSPRASSKSGSSRESVAASVATFSTILMPTRARERARPPIIAAATAIEIPAGAGLAGIEGVQVEVDVNGTVFPADGGLGRLGRAEGKNATRCTIGFLGRVQVAGSDESQVSALQGGRSGDDRLVQSRLEKEAQGHAVEMAARRG